MYLDSSSPTEGPKYLWHQWWGNTILSLKSDVFESLEMSDFAQYSYLEQVSGKYVCFYFPVNSRKYFKISYLLCATDYPGQWSDFICWSILSIQSHKTSNYRICFYYLESWRLRSQLQLYDGKNALTEKKKKKQYKQSGDQTSSKFSKILQEFRRTAAQEWRSLVTPHRISYRTAVLWIQSCEQPLDIAELLICYL